MKHHILTMTGTILIITTLCACHPLPTSRNDTRYAICNKLNQSIVMGGATGDVRQSEIQRAEQDRLIQSYDKNQCSSNW